MILRGRCGSRMEWKKAEDIQKQITHLVKKLNFTHTDPARIVCFRSHGSVSRARARIWSFPRVWQLALNLPPHYVIEVLSEKFDHLSEDDRTRVLIHELMHIPKTFSGALVPHKGRKRRIDHHSVEKFFRELKPASKWFG